MATSKKWQLPLLLLLAIAGSQVNADNKDKCGPLERIRVKSDWAKAYGTGHARTEFALAVFQAFLHAKPEYTKLFARVEGENIRSPAFRAHMARVLGGLDGIISVLENEKVSEQMLSHYAAFHTKFGHLPYNEFGAMIAKVMSKTLGKRKFGKKAWKNCFKFITSKFTDAAKVRQSPIDITVSDTSFDPSLRTPWVMTYLPANTKQIKNTGHSVKVGIDYKGTELSGGPLGKKHFCLEQFHFHWGSKNSQGSEHTVEGYAYPAELHLVHWNCGRYATFTESVTSEDGLAVLGVFLKVGSESNEAMKAVTDKLGEIKYKGQAVDMGEFDPAGLLPKNTASYWNYPGSLTTPPYAETVNWIVFKDPITITQEQLEKFRHLVTYEEGHAPSEGHGEGHHDGPLVDNYREVQNLFGREIHASFS